ncbi:MAG: nicotinamide-nucleotide amidohydrolase family protein [Magnetococcales bacterium]|nr:nicotinamide-nucleotide amidohydrolase family protein [Magnetococcales bacterium]
MGEESQGRLKELLGKRLYAMEPKPLEEVVAERLRDKNLKVATAESCTSGLIAARLGALPGSSAYLMHGLVTYSDSAKTRLLEVNKVLLERCGAVSPEVALAMARGALRDTECDLAVAVTGIAGPDGGTPEKPVGTVHLAAVARTGASVEHKGNYRGDRDRIRYQTSQTALHLLRRLADS